MSGRIAEAFVGQCEDQSGCEGNPSCGTARPPLLVPENDAKICRMLVIHAKTLRAERKSYSRIHGNVLHSLRQRTVGVRDPWSCGSGLPSLLLKAWVVSVDVALHRSIEYELKRLNWDTVLPQRGVPLKSRTLVVYLEGRGLFRCIPAP